MPYGVDDLVSLGVGRKMEESRLIIQIFIYCIDKTNENQWISDLQAAPTETDVSEKDIENEPTFSNKISDLMRF